jgi:steroid 5-alpha reductase family enzyme
MWKTVIFLLVTVIVVPVLAITMDVPLNEAQREVLRDLILIYLIAASLCFLVSTITGNHSQVDKLWSIMPIVYVWVICIQSEFEPRLMLMAAVVTVWGFRLTYNFSRRGGYSLRIWDGEEDYRWPVLRSKPEFSARWKWMLFNLLFISFYQMALILLMTLPALRSFGGGSVSIYDYIIAGLAIGFIVIETIADQQQWKFQKEKYRLIEAGEPLPKKYQKGFVDHGLWGLVRHPNYASEQSVWIVFYFFSVSATGMWLNWSVMGPILLILLFWGSSNFSEAISMNKYPEYSEYRKDVPRFVPLRLRRNK